MLQLTERTQRAVLRYILILHSLPYERIAGLLPSLTDLRGRLELPPECALALLRPQLRRALKAWDPHAPAITPDVDGEAAAAAGATEVAASNGKQDVEMKAEGGAGAYCCASVPLCVAACCMFAVPRRAS